MGLQRKQRPLRSLELSGELSRHKQMIIQLNVRLEASVICVLPLWGNPQRCAELKSRVVLLTCTAILSLRNCFVLE